MADNTGKVVAGLGIGAALLAGLAALGRKKPVAGGLQGPPPAPPHKSCNCGR